MFHYVSDRPYRRSDIATSDLLAPFYERDPEAPVAGEYIGEELLIADLEYSEG